MVLAVHFVARNAAIELIGVDPRQLPLLSGHDGPRRRVVELWDPAAGIEVADVVMNDREIPEALTLMYEADEIHVHGVVPRVATRMLPQARLETLEGTPLIVHGPWTGTTEVLNLLRGEREQVWPGPVRFDALARACWERDLDEDIESRDATGRKAIPAEDVPAPLFIDVHQGHLLPVEGARLPAEVDGRRQVKVFLAPEYNEAARAAILEKLSKSEAPSLDVEVIHAAGESAELTAFMQRTCHLVVAPFASYWSASAVALRAVAQEVPLVIVGDFEDIEPAPGVVRVSAFEDLQEIFARCVAAWAAGETAPSPLDASAARAWLLGRLPG